MTSPILEKPVVLRWPFEVNRLPLLSYLQKKAHAKYSSRTRKRLIGKPFKKLYRFAYRSARIGGEGHFSVWLNGKRQTCPFNARNSQFGALFAGHSRYGYEPETTALLDLVLRDDMVFYDIGSNWGYYSIMAAGNSAYRGPIHAFEPYPPTHRDLISVVSHLGLSDRIVCHDVALSDTRGVCKMTIPDGIQSGIARIRNVEIGVDVTTTTLDDLGLPLPDVIKIDVEDLEGAVFEGGKNLLGRSSPYIVFENWAARSNLDACLHPIEALMREGYDLYVPAWRAVSPGGRSYYVADLDELGPVERPVLSLVPLSPGLRFLMPEQINLFAVPPSRRNDLRSLFS